MITPAYQNAKKANELVSDVSTSLEQPMEPQKQRKNEILETVLPETYTQLNFSELSQSTMLTFNSCPDF